VVVLIANEAEDPLAKHLQDAQLRPVGIAGVADQVCDLGQPSQLLVDLTHGQQACVGRDLAALETGDQVLMLIEVKGQLAATVCHAKAPLAVDARSWFESIVAAQEAFFLVRSTPSGE
jgi:hypothetical protein